MNVWRAAWTPFRTLLRRTRAEDDMDEELRVHLELQTDALMRRGMSPDEARDQARRTFGSVASVKDDCRQSWGVRLVDTFWQDVRIGVRMLRRSPGFTLAVLVAMALGIGANTAIFSVVYGAVLKPLPYEGGDRVVALHAQLVREGTADAGFSALDCRITAARRRRSSASSNTTGCRSSSTAGPSPSASRPASSRPTTSRRLASARYTAACSAERRHGGRAWRHRAEPCLLAGGFGGDSSVVGKTFRFNDRPHTVIGVLPPRAALSGRERDLHAGVALPVPFESADDHRPHDADEGGVRAAEARGGAGAGPGRARRHPRAAAEGVSRGLSRGRRLSRLW